MLAVHSNYHAFDTLPLVASSPQACANCPASLTPQPPSATVRSKNNMKHETASRRTTATVNPLQVQETWRALRRYRMLQVVPLHLSVSLRRESHGRPLPHISRPASAWQAQRRSASKAPTFALAIFRTHLSSPVQPLISLPLRQQSPTIPSLVSIVRRSQPS